jgi:hypothetical protein
MFVPKSIITHDRSKSAELYSKRTWKDLASQKQFFDELAHKLSIKQPEDWYNVKVKDVIQHKGGGVLKHFNQSLYQGMRDSIERHHL